MDFVDFFVAVVAAFLAVAGSALVCRLILREGERVRLGGLALFLTVMAGGFGAVMQFGKGGTVGTQTGLDGQSYWVAKYPTEGSLWVCVLMATVAIVIFASAVAATAYRDHRDRQPRA